MSVSRRRFLKYGVGVAAAAVVLGVGGYTALEYMKPPAPSNKMDVIRAGYAYGWDVADSGDWPGFDQFDTQMGLAVIPQYYSGEETETAALLTDYADVIAGNIPGWMILRAQGENIVGLASQGGARIENILVAKEEIQTLKDLEGKKIGATEALDPGTRLLPAYAMKSAGADPQKAEWITFEGQETIVPAMIAGKIDAASLEVWFGLSVLQEPGFHKLANIADVVPGLLDNIWVAKASWVSKNEDIVRRFVKGSILGYRWVRDNVDEFKKQLAEREDIDPAILNESVDIYLSQGQWDPNGGINKHDYDLTASFFVEQLGQLKPEEVAPYEQAARTDILEDVLKEVGRR